MSMTSSNNMKTPEMSMGEKIKKAASEHQAE